MEIGWQMIVSKSLAFFKLFSIFETTWSSLWIIRVIKNQVTSLTHQNQHTNLAFNMCFSTNAAAFFMLTFFSAHIAFQKRVIKINDIERSVFRIGTNINFSAKKWSSRCVCGNFGEYIFYFAHLTLEPKETLNAREIHTSGFMRV